MRLGRDTGDAAKEIQKACVAAGFWLEQDDAVRLTKETLAGLPVEQLVEQATRLARPLTADEKAKLSAALGIGGAA
jgi:hypothetical protein